MTLPLMQFSHGNYDSDSDERIIDLTLTNAGIGPAIVKRVQIEYRDSVYDTPAEFFQACCKEEIKLYSAKRDAVEVLTEGGELGGWVSRPTTDFILPGQSEHVFQQIKYGKNTAELWEKLNDERWYASLDICYCSMLDECFESKRNGVSQEVASCAIKDSKTTN